MTLEDQDARFMNIALKEAREGFKRGDFPVGAVLTINGEYIGKASNSLRTNGEWVSHAESTLIRQFGPAIQKNKKDEKVIEIYTTLEPCLMCLGTSVMNRVGRIIYACPDPNGGAIRLNPETLGEWYVKKWPAIKYDERFREKSYKLLADHMRNHDSWKRVLTLFEEMHSYWPKR